ncbi:cell surface glycoprotein 1 [Procambarus clarkii]|uniref:cell surface glycoprotein 1 n=1 Tax=Procambarus clarkii TaxID=6728 RepID=UPI003744B175
MRDMTSMAVVMPERDRPSPKVWQPWYMEESEGGGGGKELPTRAHRDQRLRERLALVRPPHRTTPSPERGCSSEDEINVVDSPPPAPLYAHAYYAHMDDDVPLDMSTKRRSPQPARRPPHHIPTSNSPSPPPYHPRPTYLPAPARARPTVITCGPPRYLSAHDLPPAEPAHLQPHHAHRDLPPAYSERHLPPPYSVATAHLNQQRARESGSMPRPLLPATPISPAHRDAPRAEETPSLRKVVQAGPVDPEIDEHFRRSLGKDYQQLFASSTPKSPPSTDSVDDHFAKALGETWVKLQAERRDSTASNSSSSSNSNSGNSSSGGAGLGGGSGGVASRPSPTRSSPPPPAPRLIST